MVVVGKGVQFPLLQSLQGRTVDGEGRGSLKKGWKECFLTLAKLEIKGQKKSLGLGG